MCRAGMGLRGGGLRFLVGASLILAHRAGALPDLVVDQASIECVGDNALFMSVTVRNQGSMPAGAFSVGTYLSTNAGITTSDTQLRTAAVSALPAGQSITLTGVAGIPTSLAVGAYYAGGIADWTGLVAEANETNNGATGNLLDIPCGVGAPSIRIDNTTLQFNEEDPSKNLDRDEGIFLQTRVVSTGAGFKTTAVQGYALVQLEEGIQPAHLARWGATVLHPVPVRAVLAHFSKHTVLAEGAGVRWAGPYLPSDKISPFLGQAGASTVLVDVFPNVPRDHARAQLEQLGSVDESEWVGENTYVVTGADIPALAAVSEVSWIAPAPAALLSGSPILFCPDPTTPWGTVPKFALSSAGWDGLGLRSTAISYYFGNGTGDLSGTTEHTEVRRALQTWADVLDITLTETFAPGQVRALSISWATGNHGDGASFDGAGGIVGHAFLPYPESPETIAGDVHFDDAETWRIGTGLDLYSVALHELGHSLGLAHSADPTAVMNAYYTPGTIRAGLAQDDLNGILSIYPPALPWDCFRINNDGSNVLTVLEISPAVPWILFTPQPPFAIPARSSLPVKLSVNYDLARFYGNASRDLYVYSNDVLKSPYPGPVRVIVNPADGPPLPAPSRAWLVLLVLVVLAGYGSKKSWTRRASVKRLGVSAPYARRRTHSKR